VQEKTARAIEALTNLLATTEITELAEAAPLGTERQEAAAKLHLSTLQLLQRVVDAETDRVDIHGSE